MPRITGGTQSVGITGSSSPGKSASVSTATTPGDRSAGPVSTAAIRACACGDRTTETCSSPAGARSSV
jgi:hypothetical protein